MFGTTFLEDPFPPGTALSAGVYGEEEVAELTLWELGRGRYEHVGRLGWQLPSSSLAHLRGIFDVRQRPGRSQVRGEGGAGVRVGAWGSSPHARVCRGTLLQVYVRAAAYSACRC